MEKPIQDAIDVIAKAQKNVTQLLSDPKFVNNLLEINSNFKRITDRLSFMGGILTGERTGRSAVHGPITNFMGRPVLNKKDAANLEEAKKSSTPDQRAREIFITKVEKLYKDIQNFPPQSIITNYRLPEDILVIRGVAKKAMVPNYAAPREINIPFIQEIIAAIEKQLADKDANKSVDAAIAGAADPEVLTHEQIDADAELQKLGARPGDTVTMKGGKKKVTPAPPKKPE